MPFRKTIRTNVILHKTSLLMKNGLLVLNAVLVVLVGVLFYLHFSSRKETATVKAASANTNNGNNAFRIAYIDVDSLQKNCKMFKDIDAELSRREESANTEIQRMEKALRDRYAYYQSNQQMTQVQSEQASYELQQMKANMDNKTRNLQQDYQDYKVRRMKDVRDKIDEFLKDYNKDRRYSYIMAYEPNIFYYRDTLYDITKDVIQALNNGYNQKK
jgi:outer membrane protein